MNNILWRDADSTSFTAENISDNFLGAIVNDLLDGKGDKTFVNYDTIYNILEECNKRNILTGVAAVALFREICSVWHIDFCKDNRTFTDDKTEKQVQTFSTKEKQEALLAMFDLKAEDKVRVFYGTDSQLAEIAQNDQSIYELYFPEYDVTMPLIDLIDHTFIKVTPPATFKEASCDEVECDNCPLRHLNCGDKLEEDKYLPSLQAYLDNTDLDEDERAFYQQRIDAKFEDKK